MARYFKSKFWFKTGNKKIGEDTIIFSMSTARDCMGRKLGLCQVPNRCYSDKAERMYKNVLPFREIQADQWDKLPLKTITEDLMKAIIRYPDIKFIRFNENGDFRTQEDVTKLKALAQRLSQYTDIQIYGFTSRKDLDLLNLPNNLTINGSGFMVDNSFTVITKDQITKDKLICPGDCKTCNLCKFKAGREISVVLH